MSDVPFVTKKIAKKEFAPMRFFTLVRKELASIWADKQALAIVFMLPILALVALGASGSAADKTVDMLTAGRETNIGVVNLDSSVGDPRYVLGEEFIKILDDQPMVDITFYDSVVEANTSLFYEQIIGFVVINDGFEMNISAHLPAFVDFYASALYILAQPLIAAKVNDAIKDFKYEFGYTKDEINYETDDQFKLSSALFVSWPMVITLTLMASGLMLSTQSIVGDNPIMRVSLTPSKRFEIISSKIAAYTILGTMQGLVLIMLPYFAFNLRYPGFPGNLIGLSVLSALASYAGVALGVFMSTLARTKLQGSQFFLLTFMVLFILGSGVFIQGIDKIFPMGYSMNSFGLVAYKNVAIDVIWPDIWPQLVFGTIFYVAAFISFKMKKGAI
jgi:ABC-type multidrug transport system permease subunit